MNFIKRIITFQPSWTLRIITGMVSVVAFISMCLITGVLVISRALANDPPGDHVGRDEVLVGGLEGDEHRVVECRLELHCVQDTDHGVVVAVEHDRSHLSRQVLELSR